MPAALGLGLADSGCRSLRHLGLLAPWGSEWYTLTTAAELLDQIQFLAEGAINPPFYIFLLHFWIQIPWPASFIVKMRAMSVVWAFLAKNVAAGKLQGIRLAQQ